MCPNITIVQPNDFELMMVQEQYDTVSYRNCTLNFEFLSFSWIVTHVTILSHDAGQCQQATAPNQPCDQEGKSYT